MNASPVNPGGHVHIGLWLTTLHLALYPHEPGQGSWHFLLTHAWFGEQSELITHSGLHNGGDPMKPWIHEHIAWSLNTLHWLLGPHGDGWHGFVIDGANKLPNI